MTDPGNINLIVLVLVSACAFASVLGIAWPMLAPDPLASRLKVVTKQREELSKHQIDRLRQTRRRRSIAQIGQLGPIKAVLGRLSRESCRGSAAGSAPTEPAPHRGVRRARLRPRRSIVFSSCH